MNDLTGQPKRTRLRLRPTERRPILLAGDILIAILSVVLALYLWGFGSNEWLGFSPEFLAERVPVWFYFLPIVWVILIIELYDIHQAASVRQTIWGLARAAAIGFSLYTLIYFSSAPRSLPRLAVAYFLIIVTFLSIIWRFAMIRVFTDPAAIRRVLVIGGGRAGRSLLHALEELTFLPFIVIGVIDDDPDKIDTVIAGHRVMGGSESLQAAIRSENISELIVAISGTMGGQMFLALLDAQEQGIEISLMQAVYEDLFARVPIFHLEADWMLRSFVEESRVSIYYLITKRILDLLGGLLGLIAMLLVLPFVTLANLIETGWPIFYTQERAGLNARRYEVIKFRTMQRDAEKDGVAQWAQENDERVTFVGRILRKTHLDELPQSINVLRGEMSLVGPRPERPELIDLFQEHVPFYRARLLVKPGLSGWAQIHQDYASNVEETNVKLEYDLYYIKHRSFLMDINIMLRTPSTVLGFRGR